MSGPDWIAALFLLDHAGTTGLIIPGLFSALITAWVMLSPVPAIILSASDEQSCLMNTQAAALVRSGRGVEAIQLTGLGGLIGLTLLAITLPLAPTILATTHRLLAPHLGWILWSAILFIALSERPRSAPTALSRRDHFCYTQAPVWAGLATLSLSGGLGLLLFTHSPLALNASIMTFVPALIGLFTAPGLLLQICTPSPPPLAGESPPAPASLASYTRGIDLIPALTSGAIPGVITALLPALSGGFGALLAHHLSRTRSAQTQLVAQGIARMMYCGAGLMLLFLPGTPRLRNSSAALLRTFHETVPGEIWAMAGIIGFSALTAWLILPGCAKAVLRLMSRYGTRPLAAAGLTGIFIFTAVTTGGPGLLILLTASGIGLLPRLFQGRPLAGLGVILIPMAVALTR